MTVITTELPTPVGAVRIAVRAQPGTTGEVVVACAFVDHWDRMTEAVRRRFDTDDWIVGATEASGALAAYLAGDLAALDGLRVDLTGTDFQAQVWDQLRAIPTGETRSYAEIAAALGRPTATRAVGSANGRNPVWIVVPCHRVVRADGALGGYGGGLDRKQWLLAHERRPA